MSRRTKAQIAAELAEAEAFAQLHRQAALDHARLTAERDVEHRFPMASNRFRDPEAQRTYAQRYQELRQ